jgi:hypothetical protein
MIKAFTGVNATLPAVVGRGAPAATGPHRGHEFDPGVLALPQFEEAAIRGGSLQSRASQRPAKRKFAYKVAELVAERVRVPASSAELAER